MRIWNFALLLGLVGAMEAAPPVPATPSGERYVVMVGEGSVKAMPDTATISAGVVTRARRADDALRANGETMTKAVAALKATGLDEKQITTARFTFEPQYDTDRNGGIDPARRIIGYSVSNRITIVLNDKIERAGAVLDTLIQNGANDSASVQFSIRDAETLIGEASAAAAKNALKHAETYAKALGVELGAVRLVREGAHNDGAYKIYAEDVGQLPGSNTRDALQRLPGVRLEASEQTITRVVTVVWALK